MIPYGRQEICEDDVAAVIAALRSEFLTTGPAVEKFETDLAVWTDGVPLVAVSSGTAALHTAYAAANIGPGDEIITPPITFIATQATAALLGATIVFADVEEDTATIDPKAVEAALSKRTKAIVAVDYAGHPANMDALRAIADKYSLLLIEDAAHSFGSRYRGRAVGSLADITVFSFFATKNITTAEGGALASRDAQILQRAREFARQGLIRDRDRQVIRDQGPWHQEVHQFGLNYRLSDLAASLGSQQLTRVLEMKSARREIKARYDVGLSSLENVKIPVQREHVDPMWHLYPMRVEALHRKSIFEGMRSRGIGVQVNYLPAYWHPAFAQRGYPRGLCEQAEKFYAEEISLPMFSGLSEDNQMFVLDAVRDLASDVG